MDNKSRNKTIRTIAIVALIILAIAEFSVRPIGSFFMHSTFKTYVSENYTEFDFRVGFPRFCLYYGFYISRVVARDDENISFTVTYLPRSNRFTDDYNNVQNMLLTQILEKEFSDSFSQTWVFGGGFSTYLGLRGHRAPVRDTLMVEFYATEPNPQTFLEKIVRCYTVVKQHGHNFSRYNFSFRTNDYIFWVMLDSKYINEDLILTIEDFNVFKR